MDARLSDRDVRYQTSHCLGGNASSYDDGQLDSEFKTGDIFDCLVANLEDTNLRYQIRKARDLADNLNWVEAEQSLQPISSQFEGQLSLALILMKANRFEEMVAALKLAFQLVSTTEARRSDVTLYYYLILVCDSRTSGCLEDAVLEVALTHLNAMDAERMFGKIGVRTTRYMTLCARYCPEKVQYLLDVVGPLPAVDSLELVNAIQRCRTDFWKFVDVDIFEKMVTVYLRCTRAVNELCKFMCRHHSKFSFVVFLVERNQRVTPETAPSVDLVNVVMRTSYQFLAGVDCDALLYAARSSATATDSEIGDRCVRTRSALTCLTQISKTPWIRAVVSRELLPSLDFLTLLTNPSNMVRPAIQHDRSNTIQNLDLMTAALFACRCALSMDMIQVCDTVLHRADRYFEINHAQEQVCPNSPFDFKALHVDLFNNLLLRSHHFENVKQAYLDRFSAIDQFHMLLQCGDRDRLTKLAKSACDNLKSAENPNQSTSSILNCFIENRLRETDVPTSGNYTMRDARVAAWLAVHYVDDGFDGSIAKKALDTYSECQLPYGDFDQLGFEWPLLRAIMTVRLNKTEEFESMYQACCNVKPYCRLLTLYRGKMMIKLRRFAEATACLRGVTEIYADFYEGWFYFAVANLKMDCFYNTNDAVDALWAAIKLKPDNHHEAGEHLVIAFMRRRARLAAMKNLEKLITWEDYACRTFSVETCQRCALLYAKLCDDLSSGEDMVRQLLKMTKRTRGPVNTPREYTTENWITYLEECLHRVQVRRKWTTSGVPIAMGEPMNDEKAFVLEAIANGNTINHKWLDVARYTSSRDHSLAVESSSLLSGSVFKSKGYKRHGRKRAFICAVLCRHYWKKATMEPESKNNESHQQKTIEWAIKSVMAYRNSPANWLTLGYILSKMGFWRTAEKVNMAAIKVIDKKRLKQNRIRFAERYHITIAAAFTNLAITYIAQKSYQCAHLALRDARTNSRTVTMRTPIWYAAAVLVYSLADRATCPKVQHVDTAAIVRLIAGKLIRYGVDGMYVATVSPRAPVVSVYMFTIWRFLNGKCWVTPVVREVDREDVAKRNDEAMHLLIWINCMKRFSRLSLNQCGQNWPHSKTKTQITMANLWEFAGNWEHALHIYKALQTNQTCDSENGTYVLAAVVRCMTRMGMIKDALTLARKHKRLQDRHEIVREIIIALFRSQLFGSCLEVLSRCLYCDAADDVPGGSVDAKNNQNGSDCNNKTASKKSLETSLSMVRLAADFFHFSKPSNMGSWHDKPNWPPRIEDLTILIKSWADNKNAEDKERQYEALRHHFLRNRAQSLETLLKRSKDNPKNSRYLLDALAYQWRDNVREIPDDDLEHYLRDMGNLLLRYPGCCDKSSEVRDSSEDTNKVFDDVRLLNHVEEMVRLVTSCKESHGLGICDIGTDLSLNTVASEMVELPTGLGGYIEGQLNNADASEQHSDTTLLPSVARAIEAASAAIFNLDHCQLDDVDKYLLHKYPERREN